MGRFDLNLVRTFVLLYETRGVTRAAEALFVTQPSVSHALRRLRRSVGDELFTHSAAGLVPTETAERLYPRLREALEVIDDSVGSAATFDPATTQRRFRMCATDLGELTLLPEVLAEVEAKAPRCTVEIRPLDMEQVVRMLRQNEVDMAICTPRIEVPDVRREPLLRVRYVGLCAANHPRIGSAPSLAAYLAERHIAVHAAAGHLEADLAIERLGAARDIAVRVPHFAVLPDLLARSSHLSIVPEGVADRLVGSRLVRTFELPLLPTPEVEIALYTYRRAIPSEALEWMRELVVRTIRTRWADLTPENAARGTSGGPRS